MKRLRNQAGFTLMELLTASALLALLMTLLAGALAASLRAVDAVGEEATLSRQAEVALRRLTDDLACACPDAALPFRVSASDLQRLEEGQADGLVFASLRHLRLDPADAYRGPALIAYKVERGAGEGLRLLRADVPLLFGMAADAEAVETAYFPLAEGLRAVGFEPLDARGEPWRAIAVAGPGGAAEVALPAALRIRLEFPAEKGGGGIFAATAVIPAGLVHARPERGGE